MSYHECSQMEKLGRIQEFMDSLKGVKATLLTIALAVAVQVGSFLYLWGGLTTTVTKNNEYIWEKLSPQIFENTRNIDKILEKFKHINIIGIMGPDMGDKEYKVNLTYDIGLPNKKGKI